MRLLRQLNTHKTVPGKVTVLYEATCGLTHGKTNATVCNFFIRNRAGEGASTHLNHSANDHHHASPLASIVFKSDVIDVPFTISFKGYDTNLCRGQHATTFTPSPCRDNGLLMSRGVARW